MDTAITVVLSVVIGYALGSIPWAHLAARTKGLDIEAVDTGIAGAANVYRNVGHAAGVLVFLGDAGKGAAAVVFARLVGADGSLALIAVAASVVGHGWPVFGRYPGGMALAALAGGSAAIGGWPGLAALVIGATMVVLLRNAGYGGGIGFAALLVLGWVFEVDRVVLLGVLVLAAAVMVRAQVRHRMRNAQSRQT